MPWANLCFQDVIYIDNELSKSTYLLVSYLRILSSLLYYVCFAISVKENIYDICKSLRLIYLFKIKKKLHDELAKNYK